MTKLHTKCSTFSKMECVLRFVDKKDTEHISFILLLYRFTITYHINELSNATLLKIVNRKLAIDFFFKIVTGTYKYLFLVVFDVYLFY